MGSALPDVTISRFRSQTLLHGAVFKQWNETRFMLTGLGEKFTLTASHNGLCIMTGLHRISYQRLAHLTVKSVPFADAQLSFQTFSSILIPLYINNSPSSRSILERQTVTQPVKKFPAFYGTERFITVFTKAR
jgi:hypothetical protein